MADKKYKTLIVWLRRDLRVTDNAALHHACEQAEHVIPLFVLDPFILERADTGAARVAFLLDALRSWTPICKSRRAADRAAGPDAGRQF